MKSLNTRLVLPVLASALLMIAAGCGSHEYLGVWRCQTTLQEPESNGTPVVQEVSLTLQPDGTGSLKWLSGGQLADSVSGAWHREGHFISIDRTNGGFAAFKVVSLTATRMTTVNRAGILLDFVRMQ